MWRRRDVAVLNWWKPRGPLVFLRATHSLGADLLSERCCHRSKIAGEGQAPASNRMLRKLFHGLLEGLLRFRDARLEFLGGSRFNFPLDIFKPFAGAIETRYKIVGPSALQVFQNNAGCVLELNTGCGNDLARQAVQMRVEFGL